MIWLSLIHESYFQVINGSADIGSHVFTLRDDQNLFVTFGPSNYPFEYNLLVPRPQPLKPLFNILRPFPEVVYIFIAISFVIAFGVAFYLFRHYDIPEPVWFVLATTIAHGAEFGNYQHQIASVALFATVWLMGNYVLHLAYECNLRANLIYRAYTKVPTTLNDLLQLDTKLFINEDYGDIPRSFSESDDPVRKEIYRIYREGRVNLPNTNCNNDATCIGLRELQRRLKKY